MMVRLSQSDLRLAGDRRFEQIVFGLCMVEPYIPPMHVTGADLSVQIPLPVCNYCTLNPLHIHTYGKIHIPFTSKCKYCNIRAMKKCHRTNGEMWINIRRLAYVMFARVDAWRSGDSRSGWGGRRHECACILDVSRFSQRREWHVCVTAVKISPIEIKIHI